MTSEPADPVAMIDACRLVAAILREEPSSVVLNDGRSAGRLIKQLANLAANVLVVRAEDAGRSGEAARQAALDDLAGEVLTRETELLTTTGRVYGTAASMVRAPGGWPDPVAVTGNR
jgi:hypothetical protein